MTLSAFHGSMLTGGAAVTWCFSEGREELGVALAVGLPDHARLHRSRQRPAASATTSSPLDRRPARGAPRRACRRHRGARELSRLSALVRDAPPSRPARHPHAPGAARAQGRQHHDDLRQRPEPRSGRRALARRPHSDEKLQARPRSCSRDTPYRRADQHRRGMTEWRRLCQQKNGDCSRMQSAPATVIDCVAGQWPVDLYGTVQL